jgi:hypothetical protein
VLQQAYYRWIWLKVLVLLNKVDEREFMITGFSSTLTDQVLDKVFDLFAQYTFGLLKVRLFVLTFFSVCFGTYCSKLTT